MLVLNLKYDQIESVYIDESKEIKFKVTNNGIDGYIIDSILFIQAVEKIIQFYKNLNIELNKTIVILHDKIIQNKTIIEQFFINGVFEVKHYDLIKKKVEKICNLNEEKIIQYEVCEYIVDGVKINEPLKLFVKEIQFIVNVVFVKKQHLINIENILKILNLKVVKFTLNILDDKEENLKKTTKNNVIFFYLKDNCINYIYYVNKKIFQIKTIDFGMNIVDKKIADKFETSVETAKKIREKYSAFNLTQEHFFNEIEFDDKKITQSSFVKTIKNQMHIIFNEIRKNIFNFSNIEQIFFISSMADNKEFVRSVKSINSNIVFIEKNEIKYKEIVEKEKLENEKKNFFSKTWNWLFKKH